MPDLNRSRNAPAAGRRLYACAGRTTRQTIIIAALVLVIVVAFVSILRQIFGGPATPPEVITLGFTCQLCGKEFNLTNKELRTQEPDQAVLKAHPDRFIDQPNCPHCGQKHTGMPMVQCPKCEKFFLTTKVNVRANPNAVPPPPICPHCGTDANKWRLDHFSE